MEKRVLLPNSCDCHMHIFDGAYPKIANASLAPQDASLDEYNALRDRLGISRFVIVQPSIYGTDNSLLVKVLHAVGRETARGVAVIDSSIGSDELSDLYLAGVRGVRFNQVQNGVTTLDMLEALDGRIVARGMHVQFHAKPELLIEAERRLLSLKSSVVIDHIARLGSRPELRKQTEVAIYRMLESGKVWLKLSAPYLASVKQRDYADISEFISGLIRWFPQRLVWGTDWPHATEDEMLDDRSMAKYFVDMMPSREVAERIFVANPEELYGFARTTW